MWNISSFVDVSIQGYIDAQEDGFQKFDQSGAELIEADHYASDEIKDKVIILLLNNAMMLSALLTPLTHILFIKIYIVSFLQFQYKIDWLVLKMRELIAHSILS